MEAKVIEKGQIILVGFSFFGDPFAESGGWTEENEIGRLWSRFEAFLADRRDSIKHLKSEAVAYEVHVESAETASKGHREVFVGMEVEALEDAPFEMLVKILPPTRYALFTLKGEQIASDWSSTIGQWMLKAGYEPAYAYGIQRYDERFKGVDNLAESVLEVHVPVKRVERVSPDGDKALDFVEDNLKEEIAIADMAHAAGYSLYHFSRTFNRVVHHTPHDYLMRRRLSESARDLVETNRRIIDVAFDYRFNSPETFSRAFKRMFGLQPSGWKAQGWGDERFLMCRWTLEHLEHINRGDHLKPVSQEKDAFQVAGVMTLVQNRQEAIPQLWKMLAQELAPVEGSRTDGNYYGLTWYPQDWKARGRFYMVAVGVESPGVTGSALVVKTIPASRYARFIHKGSCEDLKLTRDYIYQTWLPKSGESLAHSLEIACYGRELDADQADVEWEVLIPIERM